MEQRWLAFRDQAGAPLSASLSSSLPIGRGWRGGHLLAVEELLALDQLVRTTADQTGAALGMWQGEGWTYGCAAEREHEEIPFLLGFDPASAPEDATDAVVRCGIGPSFANWRQHTAQSLAAWAVHTPRTPDPLEVDAAMQITDRARARRLRSSSDRAGDARPGRRAQTQAALLRDRLVGAQAPTAMPCSADSVASRSSTPAAISCRHHS